MMQKLIAVGENAFISDTESFLHVDVDREKKSLQKQGVANGRANFPDSQASQPDAVEQGIMQKIARTAARTRGTLSQHFDGFFQRLLPNVKTWDPTALIKTIEAIPNRTNHNLNDTLRKFETESVIRGPEWRDAQEAYEQFRLHNNLRRPADYLTPSKIVLWFSTLIVVESALNATLLWELTGFLLALGQTALITSVNVLFGAGLAGLCLRYKNHVSIKVRWRVLLCIPALLAILIFNFGVGHYRDAIIDSNAKLAQLEVGVDWDSDSTQSIEFGFTDYTKKAMESIIASPLGIDSILSALLIIVGIGFFGFATNKWYSMLDRYPGYRKCSQVRENTHKSYKILVDDTRTNIRDSFEDAKGHVADERTKVINIHTEQVELINRARTLRRCYLDWIIVLEKSQNHLLAVYRDSNQQTRTELVPSYFNDKIPIEHGLTESPDFQPPKLENVDTVIAAVSESENTIQQLEVNIWKRIDRLVDMSHALKQPETPKE